MALASNTFPPTLSKTGRSSAKFLAISESVSLESSRFGSFGGHEAGLVVVPEPFPFPSPSGGGPFPPAGWVLELKQKLKLPWERRCERPTYLLEVSLLDLFEVDEGMTPYKCLLFWLTKLSRTENLLSVDCLNPSISSAMALKILNNSMFCLVLESVWNSSNPLAGGITSPLFPPFEVVIFDSFLFKVTSNNHCNQYAHDLSTTNKTRVIVIQNS